jgi:hypothetical protein
VNVKSQKKKKANGLYFIEASAKTAANVELAFSQTAATILKNFDLANAQTQVMEGKIQLDSKAKDKKGGAATGANKNSNDCCGN